MGKVYIGVGLLLIVSFVYYQNKSADKAQVASFERQQRTIEAYEDYVKQLQNYNQRLQEQHRLQMQQYSQKLEQYYARKLQVALKKEKEKRTPASVPPLVAAPAPEPYIPPPMEEPRSDRDYEMDVQFPEPGAPLDYLPRIPK